MTAIVLLAAAFLLALFFSYIYQQKRQEYMLVWAAGWLLLSLHFLVPALGTWLAPPPWVEAVDGWLLAAAVLSFYCAARMYARLKVSWGGVAGLGVAAAIWALGYSRGWVNVPMELGVGLLFFFIARTFWQEGRKQESRADQFLAITFVGWGLLSLTTIFQGRSGPLAGQVLLAVVLLFELFAGVLMVRWVFKERGG